jgi:hypothetical protein
LRPPTSLSEWAGVRPGDNESAGKRKSGKTAPGDRWIRRTLCERAHAAARTPSHFARAFKGIKARRGYKRAVVAIARELLRTMFFLISRNDVYRDRVVDYSALFLKKVLPRWVVALKNLGRLPPKPRLVPAEELKEATPSDRPLSGGGGALHGLEAPARRVTNLANCQDGRGMSRVVAGTAT